MAISIISEGKTTNEAIEKGLKELKVSKDRVDIKVLENGDKRSFFSILTPRVVKIEMTLKEDKDVKTKKENHNEKKEINVARKEIVLTEEEKVKAKENIVNFLEDLLKKLPEDTSYEIEYKEIGFCVKINGKNIGYLIGYRGETLYSIQNILLAVAGKGINNRVKIILDIEGYKEKREKTLESLAEKIAKTVIKTNKPFKLEPMQAYERKIIHSKLQENSKIVTTSIGEDPNRRIVVSLKK